MDVIEDVFEIVTILSVVITALILLVLPLILTILNLVNLFHKRQVKPNLVDRLIMTLGPIFTVFLFGLWSGKDYNQPLELPFMDTIEWHTPLASWHSPTIVFYAILALIGYGVIRKYRTRLSPIMITISISCMIIGSIIGIVWMLQLSSHFFEIGAFIPGEAIYLCIFPFNYIICFFAITKSIIQEYTEENQEVIYKNTILNKCNLLLHDSKNWPVIAITLMIPILAIATIILILFGQQPSAIIKAFTETSDWLLSQKNSPPPIEVDGHYLCTVSLRGHPWVVKPLRYGIRKNNKIIVNRQLCVANAFEQLIQERMPRIHHFIRSIYDKYGYPLSKHIINPVSADIVYMFMKPLEWLFLVILYLLDRKPEDRIAMQYIPAGMVKVNL